jgi:hypothetical protein
MIVTYDIWHNICRLLQKVSLAVPAVKAALNRVWSAASQALAFRCHAVLGLLDLAEVEAIAGITPASSANPVVDTLRLTVVIVVVPLASAAPRSTAISKDSCHQSGKSEEFELHGLCGSF